MAPPRLAAAPLAALLILLLTATARAAPPTFLDVLAPKPAPPRPGETRLPGGPEVTAENNRVAIRFEGHREGGPVPYDPKVRAFVPVEYRLYRSRSRDLGYLLLKFLPVNRRGVYEFVDEEARDGVTFWYEVRAVDADRRERTLFARIEATPVDTKPPKRLPPPELEIRDNAIRVSFRPSDDPDFKLYRIWRSEGPLAPFSPVAEIAERGETSWVDPRVAHEKGYVYAVTVVDRAGNESVPSNDRMAVARDLAAPEKPAEIVAVPEDRGALVRFRSSTAKDLDHYRVHMGEGRLDRKTAFEVVGRIAKRDTAYVEERIRNLVNGRTYHFYVTALDAAGNESAPTPIVTATPVDLTPPAKPARLEALPMNGALKIVFDEVEDLDRDLLAYRVYRKSDSFPQWMLHKVIEPKVKRRRAERDGRPVGIFEPVPVEFVDKGLVNGLRYRYRVTAVDVKGNESEPTESVDGVPEDRMAPAAVADLAVKPGIAKVVLSFRQSVDRDLAGYVVRRRTKGDAGPGGVVADLPAEPARAKAKPGRVVWVDRGVTPGEAYEYNISGRDESGNVSEPCPWAEAAPKFGNLLSVSKAYLKNVPHAFVFSLDPNAKTFYFTKTQNYKDYAKWDGPHALPGFPPNFSAAARLSFQRLAEGVGVFCHNPETLDLYFTSSPDLKNWGAWQLLCDDLPLPPNWTPETAIAFEQYPDRVEGLAFTPLPGSVYRTFTDDGKTWRKWRPVALKVAPPANWSPENPLGVSSDDRGVTIYSFSAADFALYVSFCFDRQEFRGWYRFEEKPLKLPNRVADVPVK